MIAKYESKKLSGGSYVIEECFFVNCELTDCDLFYSGGDFEWANVKFENCRWHFRRPALKTIQLQTTIGMLKPAPMPLPLQVSTAKAN